MALPSKTDALPAPCVGEEVDIDGLYRALAPTVTRWVARLAGPGADVEDLVQEVFLVAQRRLPRVREGGGVRTWLYRVAENVVRHRRRKDRLRRWLSFGGGDDGDRVPSPAPTPVEELAQRQAIATVYRALDRLNPRYRTLMILFELEGLSGEEIAELTGIKLATVWVLLHRARRQLVARLEEQEREGHR